jgi:hypothetical protein
MSNIYKLNKLVKDQTTEIYIFSKNELVEKQDNVRDIDGNDVFSQEEWDYIKTKNIPYKIVKQNIYKDDTIQMVKDKLVKYLNLDMTSSELYLFAMMEKLINISRVYKEITQNNLLDFTKEHLSTFLGNFGKKSFDFENDMFIPEKELFGQDDLLDLDINWNLPQKMFLSLGQKIILKKNYPLLANPFKTKRIDDLLKTEGKNLLSTQNNYLVFSFGEIIDNNIYFCVAEDVIDYSKEVFSDENYLLQLYYPLLTKNKIVNLETLNKKRKKLLSDDKKRLKNFEKYNDIIDAFYLSKSTESKKVNIIRKGVKYLHFTIHPLENIKLPLETLFKIINSSQDIPLVKYNPGNRMENIYRLFTGNNYSNSGSKIPQLYIDYDNKKLMINKLSKELSTRKRVGFYIKHDSIYTLCEFLENGNIEIRVEPNGLLELEPLVEFLKEKINNLLLKQITLYLEQSGYNYVSFDDLYSDNIEINNLDYCYILKNDDDFDLKKYTGCLSTIFNVHSSKVNKKDDISNLTYKRISSFQKMTSINAFITISRKNNKGLLEIIEELKNNFALDDESAAYHYQNWQQEVQLKLDTYENKKIDVESNPGFEIEIKRELMGESSDIFQSTIVNINNITDVKYLYFIDIYMSSLFKIMFDTTIINDLLKLCKSKKEIDIGQNNELKNDKEKNMKKVIQESSDESDDALDALFESEDESDDDDEELNQIVPDTIGSKYAGQDVIDLNMLPTFSDDDTSDDDVEDEIIDPQSDQTSKLTDDADNMVDLVDLPDFSDMEDDGDDDFGELSETEGGAKGKVDLEGLNLSGANSIFTKRMRERDPKLFAKAQKNKNFQSYSQACPWQYKRQPVILSDEEKKYIDDKDKGSNSASYDEHITYGSGDKKYHYICPRFWCIRDDDGKGRSLSLKDVNDGVCGGWDAIIPENAKKIPKGKRIFEYTDKRFRRSNSNTKNPLVHKPMYPGFQSPEKHPDGLCVPCCFQYPTTCNLHPDWKEVKTNKSSIYVKKDWIFNKGSKKKQKTATIIREGWYHKDDKNFTDRQTPSKNCPSVELEHNYLPLGPNDTGPTFDKDKDGNIILDSINKDGKSAREIRQSPAKRGLETMKRCNQSEDGEIRESERPGLKKKNVSQNIDKGPLIDAFPLKLKQTAYLPISLQKFLGYDSRTLCQSNSKFKRGSFCLLRIGVEQHPRQSFLSCIAFVYNNIKKKSKDANLKDKTIKLNELKQLMIKNLTLDKYASVFNGLLPSIFKSDDTFDVETYKNTSVYKKLKDDDIYIKTLVSSYETFKKYLLDDTNKINYEYMWDFICQSTHQNGLLFEDGVNLIIFNSPMDDLTQKIELICPRIDYSNELYDHNKNTIILYNKGIHYEPICQLKQSSENKKLKMINMFFNNELINKNTPQLMPVLKEIIENKIHQCNAKNIITDKGFEFESNISAYEIYNILIKKKYNIDFQIINTNNQAIALITTKDNKTFYLPCLPSSINHSLDFKSFLSDDIYFNYKSSKAELVKLYQISNKTIPCKPVYKVVSDEFIVGILTLTNQFIPVIPIAVNTITDSLKIIHSNSILDIDKKIMSSDKIDENRILVVKQIKLETNFYNMFRNTLKMVLNKKSNKQIRGDIIDIINDVKQTYYDKIDVIQKIIKELLSEKIKFVNYKVKSISDIDKLFKCFGLNQEQCSNKKNCSFSERGSCILLIPNKNLMNETLNSVNYYIKLADELIRYPEIKKFIFTSKTFLSFENVSYKLTNHEIILLEDILLNKYFEDLIAIEFNEYLKNENIFETTNPEKHIAIKKIFNISLTDSNTNECEYVPNNPLTLLEYKDNIDLTADILIKHYKQMPICSFQLIVDIINDFLKNEKAIKKEVDAITLKKEIFQEYLNLKKKVNIDIIKKLFEKSKIENKKAMQYVIDNNDELEKHISGINYYISEIDMLMLFLKYKINVVMITKKKRSIMPFSQNNIFTTVQSDKPFYLILVNNMYTSITGDFPNKAINSTVGYPRYCLVQVNNKIRLGQNDFKNFFKIVPGFVSLENTFNIFDTIERKKHEKKKKSAAIRLRKYRKRKQNVKLGQVMLPK